MLLDIDIVVKVKGMISISSVFLCCFLQDLRLGTEVLWIHVAVVWLVSFLTTRCLAQIEADSLEMRAVATCHAELRLRALPLAAQHAIPTVHLRAGSENM